MDFDFELPSELIAQQPFFPKEKTKMLVFDQEIIDSTIDDLTDFLQEKDVMVFNNASVIKAKLRAKNLNRQGAMIDLNLNQNLGEGLWSALCRPAKRVNFGDRLQVSSDFELEIMQKNQDGSLLIKFDYTEEELLQKLDLYGQIPLPPYIKRQEGESDNDQKNYQTIYAKGGCAVAAPTAGLHFTKEMFRKIEAKGIKMAFVTLNVGAGTFLPVKSDLVENHVMHFESFSISKEDAKIINEAKKEGGRVVAVGTTSLRVLESIADENGIVKAHTGSTNIFIFPPYKFKIVDLLMTNFHLPKSTLFMLISAFVGIDNARKIYDHAISNNYRFYSYGDASLLIPER